MSSNSKISGGTWGSPPTPTQFAVHQCSYPNEKENYIIKEQSTAKQKKIKSKTLKFIKMHTVRLALTTAYRRHPVWSLLKAPHWEIDGFYLQYVRWLPTMEVWREEYLIRSHLVVLGQLVDWGGNTLSSDTAQYSPPTEGTDEQNMNGGKVGVSK